VLIKMSCIILDTEMEEAKEGEKEKEEGEL
jgi:hypothetical protein